MTFSCLVREKVWYKMSSIPEVNNGTDELTATTVCPSVGVVQAPAAQFC